MRYYRKVIRIRGDDSPNVRRAKYLLSQGIEPTPDNSNILQGVLTYDEYKKRLATWDEVRICIGIHAEFWAGKDSLMFPPDWLNRAEQIAELLRGKSRKAKSIGIDPAEG